jgi:hypothetical protein
VGPEEAGAAGDQGSWHLSGSRRWGRAPDGRPRRR